MACPGGSLYGGRRRRSSKRKTMKGGMYSFGFDPQTGTGGAGFTAVGNPAVDPVSLKPIPGGDYGMEGGRRRRRTGKKATRKGGRASRKSRKVGRKGRKTMRGGGWNPLTVNSAGVGYGFGAGSTVTSGPPDATAYAARVGGAPMNAAGVRTA